MPPAPKSKPCTTLFRLWCSELVCGFSRTPLAVKVQAGAIFSILDHYLRRKDIQKRVIGTLTGVRTESDVEVRSAFAVPHSETADQAAIDGEYFKNMLEVMQRVNPREQVLGW